MTQLLTAKFVQPAPDGHTPSQAESPQDQALITDYITTAFQAGWSMNDAYHYASKGQALKHPDHHLTEAPEDLARDRDVSTRKRIEIYLDTVDTALRRIAGSLTFSGALPSTADARRRLSSLRINDESAANHLLLSLNDLHIEVLGWMQATDRRVGNAYKLGRSMSRTIKCASGKPEQLVQVFGSRIHQICRELKELSTSFPPYSADVVSQSLLAWSADIQRTKTDRLGGDKLLRSMANGLYQQGETWRNLLAGVFDPRDLLDKDDYAEISKDLFQYDRSFLVKTARGLFWPVLLPSLAITAAVVWGSIVAASGSPAASGLITLLGFGGWIAGAGRVVAKSAFEAMHTAHKSFHSTKLTLHMARHIHDPRALAPRRSR
ncbi:hypothetical protein ACFWIQ_28695 [Kitasatospora sp. NPDC127059]|uniref:hypothetical protein n=1 Tax=unclassified Kitasatospora TaxID=2633591 RepID=UPI0036615487